MNNNLFCVSKGVLDELNGGVESNIERYKSGDFLDLEETNGWRIDVNSVQIDHDLLNKLNDFDDGSEIEHSLILFNALKGMTPSLAREERIWVRLSHIECLQFARKRWLKSKSGDELIKAVKIHFFAKTLDQCRDDNAISRLWWNAWIASAISPNDVERALSRLFQNTDVRLNVIERPGIAVRKPILEGILTQIDKDPWLFQDKKENFRSFMRVLNRLGGGVLFEALEQEEIDAIFANYVVIAKQESTNEAEPVA